MKLESLSGVGLGGVDHSAPIARLACLLAVRETRVQPLITIKTASTFTLAPFFVTAEARST